MRFSIKELPLRLISRPGFSARFWEKTGAGSPKTAVAREIGCSVETLRNWETAAPTYVNPMVARE